MNTLEKIVAHSRDGAEPMDAERHHLIYSLFEEFIEKYASRDERLTLLFSDNFSGYAGCGDILITDKAEWIQLMRKDFAEVPERINIEMLDLSLQDLAENVVVVTAFFHIHLPVPGEVLSRKTARLVLVFRQEKSAWKIVHSGISLPYVSSPDGKIYPIPELEQRNLELEQIISFRTKELAEANRLLQKQSYTDGLTNISNRRHFDCQLSEEWNRGQRNNTPLAAIMLDLDHFKSFNDLYGHIEGDHCLQKIAQGLARSVHRGGDLTARYGGEEFVVLLPDTDKQHAFEVAKHIQKMVLSLAIPHSTSPVGVVTVSLGVASLQPSNQQCPEELVRRADAALYRAKMAGRNCVKVDDETSN
jgi:diguanylate cyclase (GGDEF)-like protein